MIDVRDTIYKTTGDVEEFCKLFGLSYRTVRENHIAGRFDQMGPGYSALYRFIGIVADTVPPKVWREIEDKLMEVE